MISNRLKTIASMVNRHSIIADIGSDHALLPCYLVLENKVKKAYAIDNKQGPISSAKNNIKKLGLEDSVVTIMQFGIIDLPSDVDTLILAGMGYVTISGILENDLEIAKRVSQIIIQTNSDVPLMRKFLNEHGFVIDNEIFMEESNVYYTFIETHYNGTHEEINIFVSESLLDRKDDMYMKYLKLRMQELNEYVDYNPKYEIELKSLEKAIKNQ